MPGKRSDSDSPDWQHLRLVEHGGFAGLIRGAELRAGELDAKLAARVSQLLGKARAGAGRAADYPDGQSLSLEVQTADGPWTAHFDSADLPDAMEQLKGLLILKPMAPPKD
nr:protealysin inhibitor emfourin [uncultured Roseateles sp.]